MTLVKSQDYLDTLKEILEYIAVDKKSAAVNFYRELNTKIKTLKDFPYLYRKSLYFDDDNIRDLIYKGYSVPYQIDKENDKIVIIGITKYQRTLK